MAASNIKTPAVNTPKNGYTSSGVKPPGAFEVVSMTMTNSKGQSKDLKAENLVESFTITTELFSPVVTLTATIRDTEKFFAHPQMMIRRLLYAVKKKLI